LSWHGRRRARISAISVAAAGAMALAMKITAAAMAKLAVGIIGLVRSIRRKGMLTIVSPSPCVRATHCLIYGPPKPNGYQSAPSSVADAPELNE